MSAEKVVERNADTAAAVRAYLTANPIKCVRVSSARSSTKYPYWGVAEYELRALKTGGVGFVATSRARSDRRSQRLAELDAERTGRPWAWVIGRCTTEVAIKTIAEHLGCSVEVVMSEVVA